MELGETMSDFEIRDMIKVQMLEEKFPTGTKRVIKKNHNNGEEYEFEERVTLNEIKDHELEINRKMFFKELKKSNLF